MRPSAVINYLDLDAQPQKAEAAALPWSLTLTKAFCLVKSA